MIDFNTQMMIELLQLIYNPTSTDLVLVCWEEKLDRQWLGLTDCLIWEMVCIVLVSISWIVGWGLCGFQAGCEKKRDCQIVTTQHSPVDRFISVIPSIQSISIAVQKFRVIIIKIGPVSQTISHCLLLSQCGRQGWWAITLCWSARASARAGWWL